MTLTAPHDNNKLIKFQQEILREYVHQNMFSPYMGTGLSAIIRNIYETKEGGEQINIPLVERLTGTATSTGTLAGNEENVDNYGFRAWLDWARHAVVTNKRNKHNDSADVFAEAKPLLSDWGRELQRDELILALHALPSTSAPANLGTTNGQRVNGILYSAANDTQKDAWNVANSDRVVYGDAIGNYDADHSAALANVVAADKLTTGIISLLKRVALNASPKIRPYMTEDGYSSFVMFVGSYQFRDLKSDTALQAARREAMPRAKSNPLFRDGDIYWDGVVVREVEEMTSAVNVSGAGGAAEDLAPGFFCGQQTACVAWGQAPRPTMRKEDDYQFLDGKGIEMAYGIAKMAKIPKGGSALKDWGMLTWYGPNVADA